MPTVVTESLLKKREKHKLYMRVWSANNPEKMRAAEKKFREKWKREDPESWKKFMRSRTLASRARGDRKVTNARYYSKEEAMKASYRRQRWSSEDEFEVLAQELPDKELSELLGRSVKAIEVKRVYLKKELCLQS